MTSARLAAARERVLAVTETGDELSAVLRAVMEALHEVTTFRAAALLSVDPETILPVSGVIEGFDASVCAPFWEAELTLPGYLKFAELARRDDPVGTLAGATEGDLMPPPTCGSTSRSAWPTSCARCSSRDPAAGRSSA